MKNICWCHFQNKLNSLSAFPETKFQALNNPITLSDNSFHWNYYLPKKLLIWKLSTACGSPQNNSFHLHCIWLKRKAEISQTDILKSVQIKPKVWLNSTKGRKVFFLTWVSSPSDSQTVYNASVWIIHVFLVWTICQQPLKYNHKHSFTYWSSAFSSCFRASGVHLDRLASPANRLASQVLLSLPTLLPFQQHKPHQHWRAELERSGV